MHFEKSTLAACQLLPAHASNWTKGEHTHRFLYSYSVQIWTQHIRNGVELPEIHRDDHYDFQRQQAYSVNVTLLPGDRLVRRYLYL